MTNHDLQLRAGSNSTKMIIKSNGNVGIGTTSPVRSLHVRGDAIRIDRDCPAPSLQLIRYSSSYGQIWKNFEFGVDSGSQGNGKFNISDRGTTTGGPGAIPRITIDNGGNVGIGTTSPSAKLHVNGKFKQTHGDNTFTMYQDEYRLIFELQNSHHGSNRSICWNGDNNWDSHSDRRLKTNIEEEKNILKRLTQLKVKNFNWKDDPNNERKMIGFIAQDVQPFFPTLVKEHKDEETDEKTLTIPYASFGVLAVGAIKELKAEKDAEITAMQQEIRDLKEKNKEQAALLNKQQQQFTDLLAKVEQLLKK